MKSCFLILFLFFHYPMANAKDFLSEKNREASNKISLWQDYIVSELIDPEGENVDKTSAADFFKGKEISINNKVVTISNVCSYEYNIDYMSPFQYWQSEKVAYLYKVKLAKLDVDVRDQIGLITPAKSTTGCSYPFVYFLVINDSLVFVLNNRMIVYYPQNKKIKDESVCMHKVQDLELVYENGYIDECHYKEMKIADAFTNFRKDHADDEGKYLKEHLEINNNETVKCSGECIQVEYKWAGEKNLSITQQFNGGEIIINFSENTSGTDVIIKALPD
ncbi:hypothetical protein ACOJD9_004405 [Cronobacter dublinensis]